MEVNAVNSLSYHGQYNNEGISPISSEQWIISDDNQVFPDQNAIESIAKQQRTFTQMLQTVNKDASNTVIGPQQMLAIQYGILQSVIEIELIAKMVGSMSQSVNRLITIQ